MCAMPTYLSSDNIFKNVYGKYHYYLYSTLNSTITSLQNIIIVTDLENNLLAIFLIKGDASINFLLETNNTIFPSNTIQYTRKKSEESKSSFFVDDAIINKLRILLMGLQFNISLRRVESVELELKRTGGYFYDSSISSIPNQLILFGNKTIGDLIFTSNVYKTLNSTTSSGLSTITYDDKIYSISTTDSFIWASVLYNYLSGNSNILQSVWQKDAGGGWIYSSGIFLETPDSRVKHLLVESACVLSFIKYIIKDVSKRNQSLLYNVVRIILTNVFKIADSQLDEITNIVLNNLPLNRVTNYLDAIFKLHSYLTSDNNTTFPNPYEKLSFEIFKQEIFFKKSLIDEYINNLIDIENDFTTSHDVSILLKKLKLLTKLSNMFYMNTVSIYKNNKLNIEEVPIVNSNSNRRVIQIFNIDPKLEKVITKKKVPGLSGALVLSRGINMQILHNSIDYPVNLILNWYDDNPNLYNNTVLTKLGTLPNSNPNSLQNDSSGYLDPSLNLNKFYQHATDSYSKHPFKLIANSKSNFITNYVINKSTDKVDNDIYYKLINNTLNHSKLEIVLFSNSRIKTNITYLGRFLNDSELHRSNVTIEINLWEVDNTIGNLFYLLNFNSIQDDTLSTTLIITKILRHFKNILMNYKILEIDEDMNSKLFESIKTLSFKDIIIKNIQKIQSDLNEDNFFDKFKQIYLVDNSSSINLSDEIEDDEDDDNDETQPVSKKNAPRNKKSAVSTKIRGGKKTRKNKNKKK
jgi:hypothetical protein